MLDDDNLASLLWDLAAKAKTNHREATLVGCKITADGYRFHVECTDDGKQYVGLCAEHPSLSWLAEDEREAFIGIRRLVRNADS